MASHPKLCWKCNAPLTGERMRAELVVVRTADDKVLDSQREFIGTCPMHGKVGGRVMGHHCTISEAKMNELFPKKQRARIKRKLDPASRQLFVDALRGRYLPRYDDFVLWSQLTV